MKYLEDVQWVSHFEATGAGSFDTRDTMLELASSHRWDGYLILGNVDKLYMWDLVWQILDDRGIRMDRHLGEYVRVPVKVDSCSR